MIIPPPWLQPTTTTPFCSFPWQPTAQEQHIMVCPPSRPPTQLLPLPSFLFFHLRNDIIIMWCGGGRGVKKNVHEVSMTTTLGIFLIGDYGMLHPTPNPALLFLNPPPPPSSFFFSKRTHEHCVRRRGSVGEGGEDANRASGRERETDGERGKMEESFEVALCLAGWSEASRLLACGTKVKSGEEGGRKEEVCWVTGWAKRKVVAVVVGGRRGVCAALNKDRWAGDGCKWVKSQNVGVLQQYAAMNNL